MKVLNIAWCLTLLGAPLTACNEPFSNDDLLFLKAPPRGLRLEVPEQELKQQALRIAAPGDETPAEFYLSSRAAAESVNDGILGLLDLVDTVVEYPPTIREPDKRIWGPFPIDDVNQLALVITRIHTATTVAFTSDSTPEFVDEIYEYAMLGQKIGGPEEDFIVLFSGRSIPDADSPHGTGVMIVNFDGFRLLDPAEDGRGQVVLSYDSREGHTWVDVLADTTIGGAFEPDFAWRYRLNADRLGSFVFYQRGNLIETSPALEILGIAARWLPDNRGRADVVVTEGDVGSNFFFVSECWDPRFTRVYLASNIPEPKYSAFGDLENCGPELQISEFDR